MQRASWSSLQPGATPALTALWGASEFDLFATGASGTLLRFNGNTWTALSSGTTDLLWSISGAPNASAGFAVGLNSTLLTAGSVAGFRTAPQAPTGHGALGSLDPLPSTPVRRAPLPRGDARLRRASR